MKLLTDREVDVMTAVWDRSGEPVPTGDILRSIPKCKRNCLQTLQVILRRLVEKNFLRCEKGRQTNYYWPIVSQDEYLKYATENFVAVHYPNKTPFQYILQALKTLELNDDDFKTLRQIIDENEASLEEEC